MEGVVDLSLSILRQSVEIDVGLGEDIQQGKINNRPRVVLPSKIGE